MAKPLVVNFQGHGAKRAASQSSASHPVRTVQGNVIRWEDARRRQLTREQRYLVELERALGVFRPGEDGEPQNGEWLEGRAFAMITVVAVVAYVAIVGTFLVALLQGKLVWMGV